LKLLLHICCAPCTIFPLSVLHERGAETTGFFYNPNIHPVTEYRKRLAALRGYAESAGLPLVVRDEYGLKEFIRQVGDAEETRCRICYMMRLTVAAAEAKDRGADAFSTTLLYSVYQKHHQVREVGEEIGRQSGVPFYYEDFRSGWRQGVDTSRKMGLYRQPYCGCIYSEMERYLQPGRDRGKMEVPL
jgi:predicted adenine nucleotide alpha hydrolase (AANH) superfamily ATPase